MGWDSSGNILICHYAGGSLNGVVITGRSGFAAIGRPYYYGGEKMRLMVSNVIKISEQL